MQSQTLQLAAILFADKVTRLCCVLGDGFVAGQNTNKQIEEIPKYTSW